ncbi:MAG: phage tail protein [Sphingorhabdus sp.]
MPISIATGQDNQPLFGNFSFYVQFAGAFAPGDGIDASVLGSFSEVSGLEASMEHKVIKEGGRNYGARMRTGQVSFGTVILKRGIVRSQSLWRWWSIFAGADGRSDARPTSDNRCDVLIGMIAPPRADQEGNSFSVADSPEREAALGWKLVNAMPVKFRAGDLNAKGNDVAIEELHLVHEGLEMSGVTS